MKFEHTTLEDQIVKIDATLDKEDYSKIYADKLKELRLKGSFKGFRKGKTPTSFVEKMYGLQTLSEVVNKKFFDGLYEYVQEHKIDFILDPLLSDDAPNIEFDLKNLGTYSTSFEVLLRPDFKVAGLEDVYDYKLIKVDDSLVDEEIEGVRKKIGKQVTTDEPIQSTDIVELSLFEVDAAGKAVDGGFEKSAKVYVEDLNDNYKTELIGNKLSHTFAVDPYELEKNRDTAFVNKYLLGGEGEEKMEIAFNAVVDQISRQEPADIDQDFFDKYSGKPGEITSLDQLKDLIRENIQKYYEQQSKNLLYREIIDKMRGETVIHLPKGHIKKWYNAANEEQIKTDDELDAISKEFQWALIRAKLTTDFDVKVSDEEVKAAARAQARQYMQGYGNDENMLNYMADYILNNKEQAQKLRNEVEADKLFEEIEKSIAKQTVEISIDDFKALVQNNNQ